MDLQTVVGISQIAAALTVIGGTAFAVLQLREFRRQRQEAVALDLMRAFMGAEFAEAMAIVTSLPENLSADDLHRAGLDAEKAATLMCTTFEAMGVLVHRRIAPLPLVQDLVGGIVVVMWRRLEPWVTQLRVEQSKSVRLGVVPVAGGAARTTQGQEGAGQPSAPGLGTLSSPRRGPS